MWPWVAKAWMLHVSLHVRREKPLFSTLSVDMQILSGQGVAGGKQKIKKRACEPFQIEFFWKASLSTGAARSGCNCETLFCQNIHSLLRTWSSHVPKRAPRNRCAGSQDIGSGAQMGRREKNGTHHHYLFSTSLALFSRLTSSRPRSSGGHVGGVGGKDVFVSRGPLRCWDGMLNSLHLQGPSAAYGARALRLLPNLTSDPWRRQGLFLRTTNCSMDIFPFLELLSINPKDGYAWTSPSRSAAVKYSVCQTPAAFTCRNAGKSLLISYLFKQAINHEVARDSTLLKILAILYHEPQLPLDSEQLWNRKLRSN